jgi:hypothetical protein
MPSLYDLEEQIMGTWNITSDLKTITEAIVENELSKDQIANMLIGLTELYEIKFDKMFRTFDAACFPQGDHTIFSEEVTVDDQLDLFACR